MEKGLNKTESSILKGLHEALDFAKGEDTKARAHKVHIPDVDVKRLRERLKLTQPDFAHIFGISVKTLRNWEQGEREPTGAARVLLAVISKNPKAVLEAIAV